MRLVADGSDARLEGLREELSATSSIDDETEEMLEIAAIVEEALGPSGIHPIVVGGLAVAYWVFGDYRTHDIDVVMPHSERVEETMAALGFVREGRIWVLPERTPFFEAPGADLKPSPEGWRIVETRSGRTVRVQEPEEVLLVRMEEFLGTPTTDVLQQCILLRGSTAIDPDKLRRRAGEVKLASTLEAIDELVERVKANQQVPPSWELMELAERLREADK